MFRLLLTGFLFLFLLGNAEAEKQRLFKVINEPLPNALQKITKSSGIQFKVADGLIEERISGEVEESNWDEVVRKLLDNFNLVEIMDGKGNLVKVHVISLNNYGIVTKMDNGASQLNHRPSKKAEIVTKVGNEASQFKKQPLKKPEIALSVDQLRELTQGQFRSPLPAHLYDDMELRKFLSQNGISSAEDMNNIQKARRVRIAARRQLIILQRNEN